MTHLEKITQFDLFLPKPSEMDYLRAELEDTKELIHRVRKGQFAKIGALTKMYTEVSTRLNILERGICNGK